jgi:hypothetical protein
VCVCGGGGVMSVNVCVGMGVSVGMSVSEYECKCEGWVEVLTSRSVLNCSSTFAPSSTAPIATVKTSKRSIDFLWCVCVLVCVWMCAEGARMGQG